MNGAQLLLRSRQLSDDLVEPYYVSDEEMMAYITDAQLQLAVAGKLLRAVKSYAVKENDRWVPLGDSPVILEFRQAMLLDANNRRYPLRCQGTMDSLPSRGNFNDYGLIGQSDVLKPSRPKALIFGKMVDSFELSPISDGSYTIEASVVTYPLDDIASDMDEPEIQARFHIHIPIGAALTAIQSTENEHSQSKVQGLQAAWQRALIKVAEDTKAVSRDSAVVNFNNDFWDF
jgi:hypothetical protein